MYKHVSSLINIGNGIACLNIISVIIIIKVITHLDMFGKLFYIYFTIGGHTYLNASYLFKKF